jgi:hypothetical protein
MTFGFILRLSYLVFYGLFLLIIYLIKNIKKGIIDRECI